MPLPFRHGEEWLPTCMGGGEDKWRACQPACLVRMHSLALLSVLSPCGEPFLVGTAKPALSSFRLRGNGGLDKVMERFNVQHTGLTLVDLFNVAP